MEQSKSDADIASDVLHSSEDHARLTAEEIAKAVAHHNKRHQSEHNQNASMKNQPGKKQGGEKPK
jgi:hypothetical protein